MSIKFALNIFLIFICVIVLLCSLSLLSILFLFLFVIDIKEQLRRAERKNRDAFRKLMEEHVAAGILTAKTHWRDYCMKVVNPDKRKL